MTVLGIPSDSGNGVGTFELRIQDIPYKTATQSCGRLVNPVSIMVLSPGSRILIAKATDKAGNASYFTISIVTATSSTSTDKFGIMKLFETKSGGREWFASGTRARELSITSGILMMRNLTLVGNVNLVEVNDDGTVLVSGDQPRFYIHDRTNSKNWQNIEMTYYVKRIRESQLASYRLSQQEQGTDGLKAQTIATVLDTTA